jgi:DNA-binding transcriptional regulator YdaS (Cro superfamily)
MNTEGRWLSRTARGFLPDRNPLRRSADRVETYLLAGLFLASAAATPFAVQAASHAAHEGAQHAQQAQRAARHQVPAVLAATAESGVSGYVLRADVAVDASWTSPAGAHRSGQVLAPADSPKGSAVLVWTDAAGDLTSPPLLDSQVTGQGQVAGIAAVAGIGVLFLAEAAVVRHVLYRRRMVAWDADWRVTAQTWNHQS